MAFELKKLNYSYDSLEPHFDKQTMEIHHTKHHNAYVTNLNSALAGTDLEDSKLEEIVVNAKHLPDVIRNNAGGIYNHNFFFDVISPKGGGEPSGELAKAIAESFGSFKEFKEIFKREALSRFGSGWAWLIVKHGELMIISTPNQDNPLMKCKNENCGCGGSKFLVMGLDVWEHAYYLKYQNRRADYIDAFFNVIDWNKANENYINAVK